MSQHLLFVCFPTPVQPPSLLSALLAHAPARFSDIVLTAAGRSSKTAPFAPWTKSALGLGPEQSLDVLVPGLER